MSVEHFLQSDAWAHFQESLGRRTITRSGEGWRYLAIVEEGTGNTRLYVPYGPAADSRAHMREALQDLVATGREYGADFVRVEPLDASLAQVLERSGWTPVDYQHLQPQDTHVIDLTQDEATIYKRMKSNARSRSRNYAKKGITVSTSHDPADIDIFLTFIHQVSERTGMAAHSDEYFRAQAQALFPLGAAELQWASLDGEAIAAMVVFKDDSTAYYAHAAATSDPAYRKLNPGTALVAHGMFQAKAEGKTRWDFYGVAPVDAPPEHPWAGFSAFKRSFGGDDLHFAGAWELPLKPLKYSAYRAALSAADKALDLKQTGAVKAAQLRERARALIAR